MITYAPVVVKSFILSGLYYKQDFCTIACGTFGVLRVRLALQRRSFSPARGDL